MAFEIRVCRPAVEALKALRAFDQRRITEAIAGQLTEQPTTGTRNRKRLDGVTAAFEFEPPLWELRCGIYRVFYDVDQRAQVVNVRAIRQKSGGQTTEEVLHEGDDA